MKLKHHLCYALIGLSLSGCALLKPAQMGVLQSPAANIPGQFHQMTTYRSQNGQLNLDLKAEKKQIELDGTQIDALTFNGEYAGPILRLKQGDVLHVNLTNATDEITNFHYILHGGGIIYRDPK